MRFRSRAKNSPSSWLLIVAALSIPVSNSFSANNPNGTKAPSPTDPSNRFVRQLEAANGLLNRGLFDLAEAEYRAVLAGKTDKATIALAQYGLAISLFRMNRYNETVNTLDPLSEDGQFTYAAEVGIMRGQCLLALGRFEAAATAFESVATSNATQDMVSQAIVGTVESHYRFGANTKASEFAKAMKARIPQGTLCNRASLFHAAAMMNLQETADATALLQRMQTSQLTPELKGQVHLLLGQCAGQMGDDKSAVKSFRKVLASDSQELHAEAQLGLADAQYRLGNLEAAEKSLARLLQETPSDTIQADALILNGRLQFDRNAFKEARKSFEAARQIPTANQAEAEYWIAKCALRLGSAKEAVKLFDQWHDAHADNAMTPEASYDRAIALVQADRLSDAAELLTTFRKQYSQHPLDSNALHMLAEVAHRTGNATTCNELCEAYIAQYADRSEAADIYYLAAGCAFRVENWKLAMHWDTQFLTYFPNDQRLPGVCFRAGMACYHLEEFESALDFFLKLLVQDQMPAQFSIASLVIGDIHFQAKDWKSADRWLTDYLNTNVKPASGDDALLKRGLSRQGLGNLSGALADFAQLIRLWENSVHRARAYLERGEILALQGDKSAAKAALESAATETGSKDVATQATFQQAVLAMQAKQYEQAANHFTSFLIDETDDARRSEALYQRGQCFLASGDLEKALSDFSKLTSNPRNHARTADALAWSFVTLIRQDRFDEALEYWGRISPSHLKTLVANTRANVLYERAWALRNTGRTTEALEAYSKVLALPELAPNLQAHSLLGIAELELKDKGCIAAEASLQNLIALKNEKPPIPPSVRERALYRLGLCALDGKKWKEAHQYLSQLLREFPHNADQTSLRLYAGEAALRLGKHAKAREHLEYVVNQCTNPQTCAPALLRLGECLALQQQWVMSERVLQDFLTRFGSDDLWYQAQFGVAWARDNQARYDEAIGAYQTLIEKHRGTTSARAQFQIGECLFAMGEHETAAREFLKVDILYNYPKWSAASLYEAGRCFELLDRKVEARVHFQAVIDRFADSQWAGLSAGRIAKIPASVVPGH